MNSSKCTRCLQRLHNTSRTPTSFHRARNFHASTAVATELPSMNGNAKLSPSLQPQGDGNATLKSPDRSQARLLESMRRNSASSRSPTKSSYAAYGASEALYKLCRDQANYNIPQAKDRDFEMPRTKDGEDLGTGTGWWFNEMGLQPTFSTWSHVTMFYMYLLLVRFRCFPEADSRMWQQQLLDHFFYDTEDRMVIFHRMHARQTRNKYLKDLHLQWRGCIAAYDEAIMRGDAWLAAALWRNVFKADPNFDAEKLGLCVKHMRQLLQMLDATSDQELTYLKIDLSPPRSDAVSTLARSSGIDMPFTEPLEDVPHQ